MTVQAPPQHLAQSAVAPWSQTPSSPGHGQGEQLCPQVYCWEALACVHPLPNARPFQSLVSILVLALPAWLARLGLALLGLEPTR